MLRAECNDRFDKLEKMIRTMKFSPNDMQILQNGLLEEENQLLDNIKEENNKNPFVRYLINNLKFSKQDLIEVDEIK